MKYIIILLLSLNSYAEECKWSTGVSPLPDGSYKYSKECHLQVGKLVIDNEDLNKEVQTLNKSIELKNLAIDTNEKRAELWMNTSFKLEEKVNKIDKESATNQWLFFGLGAIGMFGATWLTSQLHK